MGVAHRRGEEIFGNSPFIPYVKGQAANSWGIIDFMNLAMVSFAQ